MDGRRRRRPSQLRDLDGNPVRLADLRGKLVWLNFWATWCPPCQAETPVLREMDERYRDQGLAIVAVAVQETTVDDVRAYAERYELDYPIAFDASADIFDLYRVFALPTQFFIGPDGRILEVVNGPLTREAIEAPPGAPGCRRGFRPGSPGTQRLRARRHRPLRRHDHLVVRCRRAAKRPPGGPDGHPRNRGPLSGHGARPAAAYSPSNRKRSRSGTSLPTGIRASCDSTTVQSSSTARRNSSPLTATRVEREVVERGHPARVRGPRPHAQVAEERERPCARPGPAHDHRLVARRSARRSGRPRRPGAAPGRPRPSPRRPSPPRAAAPAGRTRPRPASCRRARSPTRRAGRRSSPAGTPASPSARSRPPAWSKWRWLIATTSTDRRVEARLPQRRHDRRAVVPAHRRVLVVHPLADAGLDQHAAGRRLDQQAVERLGSRRFSSSSPSAQARHRTHGTGPRSAPGVGAERAGLDRARRVVPPPRSVPPVDRVVDRPRLRPPRGRFAPALEVRVERGRGGLGLALVLGAELLAAVRPLHGRAHPEEADLADPHAEVERDRQVGDVRQLERQVPFQPGST